MLLWKCPLPQWGASTPVIWGDSIFLTSHVDDDRLLLLCIDKKEGKVVWEKQVGAGAAMREGPERREQKFHQLHNLASPSCVTDGKVVAAHFGNGDLAAYDFQGRQLWKRNLQDDHGGYTIWWGHSNSPVIHDGLIISVCMQDSLADLQESPVESYLVAHDLRDGHVKWKTARATKADAEECDSYTTPLVLPIAGRMQLVVMGGNQLDGYDPATGEQLWFLPGLVGGRTVTSPTAAGDLIFATRGMKMPLVAVRPGGRGELSRKAIVWDYDQGTPDSCSPVVWGDLLFTVSDDGIARCLNAATGVLKWKERLKGDYKASPIAAGGRIYFLNTTGLCTVVSASGRFDKLTENQLDDETIASPAISDGRLFVRGKKNLYCIGR
jgi:outer membrane protein assembly factor BamB